MNILVVGNGFDIAHFLPTRYTDFLEVAKRARNDFMPESFGDRPIEKQNEFGERLVCNDVSITNDNLPQTAVMKVSLNFLEYFIECVSQRWTKGDIGKPSSIDHAKFLECALSLFNKKTNELDKYNTAWRSVLTGKNVWMEYFQAKTLFGDGWVDFEREIKSVVSDIEKKFKNNDEFQGKYNTPLWPKGLCTEKFTILPTNLRKNISIMSMEKDLHTFTVCLEFYLMLIDHIKEMWPGFPRSVSTPIKDIKFDGLLSFNYTHTYENFYNSEMNDRDKEYIHGECGDNNLVIGFDDTLNEGVENTKLLCVGFKKYFQRVLFRTGMKYKKWFKNSKDKCTVYIFGHSLDTTDKDVLSYVMEHAKKTVVFYHDEKSHREKIVNAIKIIGRDNMIKWSGSGKLEFRCQKNEETFE